MCLFVSAAHSLLVSLTFSAGAMLPEGGAGAVWCHATICPSYRTDWTRQIHWKPCTLVSVEYTRIGSEYATHRSFPSISVCTFRWQIKGKTNIDEVLRLERRELWFCETEFWSFVLLTVCTDLPSSPFPSSGVWAEERDPQATGVQKSRDQVFLQWV